MFSTLNITSVLARRLRDLPRWLTSSAVLVVFVVSVWVVTRSVDPELLGGAADRAWDDQPGAVIVVVALFTAFALRAKAWTMLLSELRFGQALAAVHLALGANHVLPLRLGEATRIASVVRRARIPVAAATTTTIALRAADTLALLALGGATAALVLEGRLLEMTGIGVPTPDSSTGGSGLDVLLRIAVAVAVIIGVVAVGAIAFVMARRRRGQGVADISRLQLVAVAASVVLAWLAEAIAVWQITTWFDLGISPVDAVFVLAVAVSAQLVAVTPAGFGTYEAAATAALVAVGVDPRTALTVAVAVHGVKTLYALAAGATALAHPAPGLLGRWRLPSDAAETSQPLAAAGDHTAPVVLFLPAHDEGPRVASVIERTPTEVSGHPVEVLVIDDGSSDDTMSEAVAAGAQVIRHPTNLGLGAAVRTGLAAATARRPAAVAFCDADGEYDPAELGQLVQPILKGSAHYVVGSRFAGQIDHMYPHRRLGNRALTQLVRWMTRTPVTDGQSGYRAFSPTAAAAAEIAHDYNYAQVLTVDLLGKGFGYHELPIRYRFRTSGRSFVRLGPYLAAVLPTLWRRLNEHPIPDTPIPEPSPRLATTRLPVVPLKES